MQQCGCFRRLETVLYSKNEFLEALGQSLKDTFSNQQQRSLKELEMRDALQILFFILWVSRDLLYRERIEFKSYSYFIGIDSIFLY